MFNIKQKVDAFVILYPSSSSMLRHRCSHSLFFCLFFLNYFILFVAVFSVCVCSSLRSIGNKFPSHKRVTLVQFLFYTLLSCKYIRECVYVYVGMCRLCSLYLKLRMNAYGVHYIHIYLFDLICVSFTITFVAVCTLFGKFSSS